MDKILNLLFDAIDSQARKELGKDDRYTRLCQESETLREELTKDCSMELRKKMLALSIQENDSAYMELQVQLLLGFRLGYALGCLELIPE